MLVVIAHLADQSIGFETDGLLDCVQKHRRSVQCLDQVLQLLDDALAFVQLLGELAFVRHEVGHLLPGRIFEIGEEGFHDLVDGLFDLFDLFHGWVRD